jgi:hypothetical protein
MNQMRWIKPSSHPKQLLYPDKSAGADYWRHVIYAMMNEMGFQSCKADPDVWFRLATKYDGAHIIS